MTASSAAQDSNQLDPDFVVAVEKRDCPGRRVAVGQLSSRTQKSTHIHKDKEA
jgi:hypothetical protein